MKILVKYDYMVPQRKKYGINAIKNNLSTKELLEKVKEKSNSDIEKEGIFTKNFRNYAATPKNR